MKHKILAVLIAICFLVIGCGITSRDTVSDSAPKSTIQVYLLTDKGISFSYNNSVKWEQAIQKTKQNNIPSSIINDLVLDNNNTYLATDRGLGISTDNMKIFTEFLPNTQINAIDIKNNNILLATNHGVYLATANNTFRLISEEKPINKTVYLNKLICAAYKNDLMVCTENINAWSVKTTFPGLIKDLVVANGKLLVLTESGFYIDELAIKLDSEKMRCMFYDQNKNIIWVSTEKGLHKSSDLGKSWVTFDKTSGLDNLAINSIYVNNLNMYLGSDYGLMQSLNAGETWKIYKKQNGLISNKVLKVLVKNNN